jgi:anti-sigma factor RsiW
MSATPHLAADDAASYLDGTLSDDARVDVERHIAECDTCREEIAVAARLVATIPPATRRTLSWWRIALPLAAGIVAVVMLRRPATAPVATSAERAAPGDASAITLVFPAPDGILVPGTTRLVWRPIDGGVRYSVVMKDQSGAPVWESETTDTVLAVPAGVALREGETYVWRVDGQRSDLSSVSSAEASVRAVR